MDTQQTGLKNATQAWTRQVPLSIAAALEKAWDKRNAGDIDGAYDIYLDIMSEHGIFLQNDSVENAWRKLEDTGFTVEESADYLLLDISFLRNQRNLQAANGKMRDLTKLLEGKALRPTHRFYQQNGLNCLAGSNLSKALEFFVLAKRHAKNAKEFHLAYLNSILCMEDLSLEFRSHLDNFLRSFLPYQDDTWALSIQGQIQALRLRGAFKNSQVSQLPELLRRTEKGEQAIYYACWLSKLPPLGLAQAEKLALEKFSQCIATQGFNYLTNYRMRTLSLLLMEEDLSQEIKLGDKVERLYLWVWQWLLQPSSALLEKILLVKMNLQKNTDQNLSFEDYQLLDLSLRWLGLFSGLSEAEIQRNLKGWNFSLGNKIAVLDYEKSMLDYLFSLRNKSKRSEDAKAALLQHPAHGIAGFSLPGILNSDTATRNEWAALRSSIASLRENLTASTTGLSVELLRKRISIHRRGHPAEEILSPILSQLLFLFISNDSVTKTQLMSACFGIHRFDSFVHDPKIANLLTKANKTFAPFASFQTRGSHVYAALDRKKIAFLENSEHALLLAQTENSQTALLEESSLALVEKSAATPTLDAYSTEWQSRQSFESLLSVSKATAARMLKNWVENGLADVRGSGKTVQYKISEKLFPEIQKLIMRKENV